MNYKQFEKDEKTKDAVVRNLEIIGESANQIPNEIQQKYSNIPWAQIVALRNRMIHGYFTIDYRIVWEIVKQNLPSLKKNLEEILKKEQK
jgi:uncharacterized protein with HEPN domain